MYGRWDTRIYHRGDHHTGPTEVNLYLWGSFPSNITSENRWFDAGRFRGGRGYGSGSGSVIWERRKRGAVFCAHPIGRSPAGKCRISKGGGKGSFSGETGSFSNRKEPRTSGRGLAVRFGTASWASLVICFCRLEGDVFWWSCSPRCMFLSAGKGFFFAGRAPFSLRF